MEKRKKLNVPKNVKQKRLNHSNSKYTPGSLETKATTASGKRLAKKLGEKAFSKVYTTVKTPLPPFANVYEKLASLAYDGSKPLTGSVDGYIRIIGKEEYSIFLNETKKEITIAFRGTASPADLISDYELVVKQFDKSKRFQSSLQLSKKYLDVAKRLGYTMTVTGHSLGGALANYVASEIPETFSYTYNAGSSITRGTQVPANSLNYRNKFDLVSQRLQSKYGNIITRPFLGDPLAAHRIPVVKEFDTPLKRISSTNPWLSETIYTSETTKVGTLALKETQIEFEKVAENVAKDTLKALGPEEISYMAKTLGTSQALSAVQSLGAGISTTLERGALEVSSQIAKAAKTEIAQLVVKKVGESAAGKTVQLLAKTVAQNAAKVIIKTVVVNSLKSLGFALLKFGSIIGDLWLLFDVVKLILNVFETHETKLKLFKKLVEHESNFETDGTFLFEETDPDSFITTIKEVWTKDPKVPYEDHFILRYIGIPLLRLETDWKYYQQSGKPRDMLWIRYQQVDFTLVDTYWNSEKGMYVPLNIQPSQKNINQYIENLKNPEMVARINNGHTSKNWVTDEIVETYMDVHGVLDQYALFLTYANGFMIDKEKLFYEELERDPSKENMTQWISTWDIADQEIFYTLYDEYLNSQIKLDPITLEPIEQTSVEPWVEPKDLFLPTGNRLEPVNDFFDDLYVNQNNIFKQQFSKVNKFY